MLISYNKVVSLNSLVCILLLLFLFLPNVENNIMQFILLLLFSFSTVSYLTSVSSDRSLKSGVNFTSLVTTATRSSMSTSLKTVNVTHFSSGSSASSAIISFGHSEGSIVSVCYQKIVLYQPEGFTATPFLEIESAISFSLVRPSTLLVFSHLSS